MISISQHKKSYNIFEFANLRIYNSVYKYVDSNMYIIIENSEAIIIDPQSNEEIFELLNKNNVKKIFILLTHEHPDHISGIYEFQNRYDTVLISSKACADYISQEKNVRPLLITFILEEKDKSSGTNLLQNFKNEFVARTYIADKVFETEYEFNWHSHLFKMFTIQGHSKGSCGILLDDKFVFTGDTLLKEYPIITRFPGGSTKIYINETIPLLEKKLKSEMLILPGHGKPFLLNEIMKDGKINVELK